MIKTGSNKKLGETITLHIYDLDDNVIMHALGFGAHHSGVEVCGTEYSFGTGGIVAHEPRKAMQFMPCMYRSSISLGTRSISAQDMNKILDALREVDGFIGERYHTLTFNCNLFCEHLVKRVLQVKTAPIPAWVNRSARFAGFFARKPDVGKKQQEQEQMVAFSGQGRTLREKSKKKSTSVSHMVTVAATPEAASTNTPTTPSQEILVEEKRSKVLAATTKRLVSQP